ncbi:unnamed protein product [Closterium sp. NIES-65]|nr:unnamed protein product [Closterium sp. NIES-65]CAI5974854.1 unnamed protein product [Closterium sp. NIES-65]CAI5999016.1 unnamed protein product [Closterium sp. NIES-65]
MVNALNLVKRVGVDYVPPKRKYIGGAGLLSCRNGIEQDLVGIKASWKRTGMTVSSDMMTDRNGRPQANVLIVNDSSAVFTDCIDCNMERKTGSYVARILRPVVEEVGPENVVAFCMDGGSNYAVAVKQLIWEWPHIQDVPCAPHVLDLLMEDVGKMGSAKPVVDKGGEISSFVRNHHWTRGYLWKPELVEGKVLQALKPAGTRFETNYIAISRLCAMRGSLTNMLTEDVGGLLDADEEQLSDGDKDKIRRILRDGWDGSLACATHVAGGILNPANQEEDIFGIDPECTKVFKAFISQQAEFLASRGDGGDDACDILLELGDGLRAFLDMKGSFGMPEAVAQRKLVKEGKYSMVKWWQWNGTDAPRVAELAVRVLSQAVSASPSGYNGLEDETKGEDEEEGKDDILEDEYAN